MFKVLLSKGQYEYDIHSLIKAFYPGEEVRVVVEGQERKHTKDVEPSMKITFENSRIVIEWKGRQAVMEKRGNVSDSAAKNQFKLFFYEELAEASNTTLPWGNLTGIRPTKIAMTMMEEGKGEDEVRDFLRKVHKVSEEKINLSLNIAKLEKQILSPIHYEDGYSLYIGIPFCPTTCLYCSFTSYPVCSWEKRMGEYIGALEQEILYTAESFQDKVLDTVYIGGGTPTTLQPQELDRVLSMVRKSFDFSAVKEFTVEAGRADSITLEKLLVMKKHGVTRISINPQTMKEETLRLIGRKATAAETVQAYHMAREAGFDNINMDIILGLPKEGEADVAKTIDMIQTLQPDSLTVHSLAIKRASRLSQWIETNGISTLRNTDRTMEIAAEGAKAMNMKPYYLYRQKNMSGNFENVGYAREGKYGIYNILIMEEKQTIVALGAGSITKRVYPDGRIERCDNVKDVELYMNRIQEMIERKKELFAD